MRVRQVNTEKYKARIQKLETEANVINNAILREEVDMQQMGTIPAWYYRGLQNQCYERDKKLLEAQKLREHLYLANGILV